MNEASDETEIVYVWPYLTWGGAQVYFFGLMKLARESYRVTALMPKGSAERLLGYLKRLQVPYEFFDGRLIGAVDSWRGRLQRRWSKIHFEWSLARYLGHRKLRRTILHLDIAPWSSFWLLGYLSLRSNVFVTLHTGLPRVSTLRFVSWLVKFRLLSRLPGFHLLTSNREVLESLRPFLPDAYLRKVPIAYSGIDVSEINEALAVPLERVAWCERFGISPDAFLVFSLGQFIERKGCHTLLEAARELRAECPHVAYVWIGTDQLDAAATQQIADSGMADRFHYVSGQELGGDRLSLLTLLRLADLFVLASLQEGLPIALLEAMALGKACIATEINAIPEAIQDEQTGVLIPAGDSGALAETIAEMVTDGSRRQRLGAAARQLVMTKFDERLSAEVTLTYYGAATYH
jgi:glycosyltransferase involved in cell wall biosynthesis